MKYPHLMGTMNQLSNTHNKFQGNTKKVLFVCSAGLLRSPTAAHVFSSEPYNLNTRAAGSNNSYALVPVSVALMEWADVIFFMNEENKEDVEVTFGKEFLDERGYSKKMFVLNVPDDFKYRNPELVRMLKEKVEPFLPEED